MRKINAEKKKEMKQITLNICGRILLYLAGMAVVFLATYYGIIYALS